ncbi:MAG: DNA-3-methyladenine glycosylase [Myxococcota bacterium]
MRRLDRAFFARPVLAVAPDLLGCRLVRVLPDGARLEGRIVEVEAYLGDGSDAGSHSQRGETRRNRSMFGPPGHFYVYLSHGLHFCANLVCEPAGTGAAVLLRAVEPLAGEERMRALRGGRDPRELTNGPGKLAQAFAITREDDGAGALRGSLRIEARPDAGAPAIATSTRIGLGKGVDLPYRFFVRGSAWVSRPAGRALPAVPIIRASCRNP